MEKNPKQSKKIIIIGVIIAVVAIIAGIVIFLMSREESYRVVKIYELDGTATVTREDTGEIEIYPNMVLASGDEVWLKEGLMTLKLDEDKYVYVEENTRFSLQAKGNAADSETSINLIEGAIVNEIRSPLSEDASYEVHTQNSSMSVRGTTFRVAIYYDEEGTLFTKVSVFDGKVQTQLVYKDGTKADPRMIEVGKETVIFEDDTNTNYLEGITDIKYEELSVRALETLVGLVKEGLSLPVSVDDLNSMITSAKEKSKSGAESETDKKQDEPEQKESEDDSQNPDEDEKAASETEPSTDDSAASPEGENKSETPPAASGTTVTYTVTFMYNGQTFATQSVSAGGCASQPVLSPEAAGNWDFDFSTAITQNISINWKGQSEE